VVVGFDDNGNKFCAIIGIFPNAFDGSRPFGITVHAGVSNCSKVL